MVDKNNILLVAWIFSGFLYTSARGACTTVMIFFSFNSLSSSFKFISFIYVSFFQKYLTTQTQLMKRKFLCFTPIMPQFPWTWPGTLISQNLSNCLKGIHCSPVNQIHRCSCFPIWDWFHHDQLNIILLTVCRQHLSVQCGHSSSGSASLWVVNSCNSVQCFC